MKKPKVRLLACMMALCCTVAVSPAAFAAGYYASDESGKTTPPSAIESISVSQESVSLPAHRETNRAPLTPSGNLSLIDDILASDEMSDAASLADKQFITVQSKNGNYFYLVIDRSGDTENVYLLNLVDEADLMALLEDGTQEILPTCSCSEKCQIGAVNLNCAICKNQMVKCAGLESPVEEPPTATPETPEAPAHSTTSVQLIPLLLLLLVLGAGGAAGFYFYTRQKQKPDTHGSDHLDEYDFGEPEEEAYEPDPAEEDAQDQDETI